MCAYDGPACLILLYQQEVLRGYCKQKSPGHRGWSDWCVRVCVRAPCARVHMPSVFECVQHSVRRYECLYDPARTRGRALAMHITEIAGAERITVMPLRRERRKCIVRVLVLFCFFTANRTYTAIGILLSITIPAGCTAFVYFFLYRL